MTAGRPSTYSAEKVKIAEDYLINHEKMGDPVPTIEGLACECGVSRETIYAWRDEHPEFSDTVRRVVSQQGRLLQAKGLKKETDSGITKLMLSANHGMAEKSEQKQENTGTITIVTKVPERNGGSDSV